MNWLPSILVQILTRFISVALNSILLGVVLSELLQRYVPPGLVAVLMEYSSRAKDCLYRSRPVASVNRKVSEPVPISLAPRLKPKYGVAFIDYPIWWGIAACPADTFVKASGFTGKTVIPFCTSSSSGLGRGGKVL